MVTLRDKNIFFVISGDKEDLERDKFGLGDICGVFDSPLDAREAIELVFKIRPSNLHYIIIPLNLKVKERYVVNENKA